MFAARSSKWTKEEVLGWLEILALALMIAILTATLAWGEDTALPTAEPGRVPASMKQLARPISVLPMDAPDMAISPQVGAVTQVWQILVLQKSGKYEQVIDEWQAAPLACEAEVWRHVARGQAALGLRQLKTASDALETALAVDPHNAVAHYFLGLLRLEQAAQAGDWYDAIGPTPFRLVALRMPGEPSMTKSMYRLAARMDLEQAIEEAGNIRLDEPLCMEHSPTGWALDPTVQDLLIALRAEDFEGKAHHVLGYLLLEDGAAREAEQHLDRATALGQSIVFGYQDLGAEYQRQHEHMDAVRAYAKALRHGSPLARPMTKIWQNLRQAIAHEF